MEFLCREAQVVDDDGNSSDYECTCTDSDLSDLDGFLVGNGEDEESEGDYSREQGFNEGCTPIVNVVQVINKRGRKIINDSDSETEEDAKRKQIHSTSACVDSDTGSEERRGQLSGYARNSSATYTGQACLF